jgi:two-component system cell cycle sensor histidine kinase/response regulator CckA
VSTNDAGVTERRAEHELLRESEERYRILFEASPLPMWVFELETFAIAAVNEAAVLFYGYTRAEFLAMTVPAMLPPGDGERIKAAFRHEIPKKWRVGIRQHRRKDGRPVWVDIVSHEIVLAGRKCRLSAMRDVTQERALEEQLRQAQKMEAVGRLAGGVAHDFNNQLTTIIGYSDLLLGRLAADDAGREPLRQIRRAGERAAALIRQLLAFSRKQVMVPEVLDLGALVGTFGGMLERLIGENIKIEITAAPGLGWVEADPGQMEQVIMNLAVNARDAMPHGGWLIFDMRNVELDETHAAACFGLKPGPHVLLAVRDTGAGMEAETRSRIFEPFFTTKERGKGTGLGLSTVHGIVNQSGGAISVHSEPGQGSTFEIYLPQVAGAQPAALHRTVDATVAAVGTETILLVEDEEQVRRLAQCLLAEIGYTVLTAADPVDAQRIAQTHQGTIHLLLTDVVMPGISGRELVDLLVPERPGLRPLYMSGYTDDAFVHHGVLEPGAAFLQKPFTPHQLAQKVREVLGSP